jgi:hypothetical protein
VQALSGNLDVWHDPLAPDPEKAIALCWILHITGDLHQPLHTVALFSQDLFPEGDRGGNLIEVRQGPDSRNLHYVWDSLVDDARDVDISGLRVRTTRAGSIDDTAIETWVRQHANLARLNVYSGEILRQLIAKRGRTRPPVVRVSDEYLERARGIAARQLVLAGGRAADLLRVAGTP